MNRQRAALIDRLESSGQDYMWNLDQLPEGAIHTATAPGEWTVHQIASHMRDTEQHAFLLRAQRLCRETHPMVDNFDQEAWMREHYLAGEPLRKISSEFRTARRKLIRVLREAGKEDWQNWATHPEYGKINLDWVAQHNYIHTLDHSAQIGRLREESILAELKKADS